MRHLMSPAALHCAPRLSTRGVSANCTQTLVFSPVGGAASGISAEIAAPSTCVLSSPSPARLSYYPAKPMWRFLSQRATSANTIEVMNKAAAMAHSRAPLPWSGSTPKRTSIHSRVMRVNMASPAANVARATSIQNRMCGFTVFGPLYPKVSQFRILRVALVVVWRNQFTSYSRHRAGTH
jgi:hypothetical protein